VSEVGFSSGQYGTPEKKEIMKRIGVQANHKKKAV